MRLSFLNLLILAPSALSACGGGARSPANSEPSSSVEHVSASANPHRVDTQAAPAPPPAADAAQPSLATGATSSDDLVAPASDDPWMAPHQMASNDVLKTMRAAQAKVTACWRAAKKRDPSVSGEVKIKFVITHEGSVRVWRNEDSAVSDEDCINCVGGVIKSLQFPTQRSPGEAWGIYQINFGG
jgi:hypothetical protein